jgi:hypothetical protein
MFDRSHPSAPTWGNARLPRAAAVKTGCICGRPEEVIVTRSAEIRAFRASGVPTGGQCS